VFRGNLNNRMAKSNSHYTRDSTRAVDWQASVHDQSQLEIAIDYRVPRSLSSPLRPSRLPRVRLPFATESKPVFQLDVYFFTPKNLGLNSQTYSRESFYKDLTNFVRIHTPHRSHFGSCVLPSLDDWFRLNQSKAFRPSNMGMAVQELKLFGNYVNLKIKTLFNKKFTMSSEDWKNQSFEIIGSVTALRSKYLGPSMADPAMDSELRSAILWVDEYLSNRLEASLSQLPSEGAAEFREFLNRERIHRSKMGYLNANREATERQLEHYYHRHGMLKKFVSEILYLGSKEVKRDRAYRNVMAGCGAALAGLWAEIAKLDSHFAHGARDFGARFIVVAMVGVLIYVSKDRIKDVSKEYFNEKMKGFLPDFEVLLSYDFFDRLGLKKEVAVGKYQEQVGYLSDRGLPTDVKFVRELTKRGEVQSKVTENAIHYSKRVWIQPTISTQLEMDILTLKDIFRFNISEFLNYFDNPEKNLAIYDFEEGVIQVRAPKVYYFNIFLRLVSWGEMKNGKRVKRTQVEHLQLVLNKSGIVRIDSVIPRGEHWYEDEVS
jgi:hypothetical protein